MVKTLLKVINPLSIIKPIIKLFLFLFLLKMSLTVLSPVINHFMIFRNTIIYWLSNSWMVWFLTIQAIWFFFATLIFFLFYKLIRKALF